MLSYLDISIIMTWVICAIVTIAIGNRKGNPIGAAFLGFVLGPIAIPIVLLSGDKNRIACPYCAEQIMKSALVCPHCRKELASTTNGSQT